MAFNPWIVESIRAFYYLKCPECKFNTKEENSFEDHAIENHPMSYELFGKKSVTEEEFDSVMIKEEQMSDFDEKENNCEQFDFHHTEMVEEGDLPEIGEVKKELIDEHFVSEDHITSDFDEKDLPEVGEVRNGYISSTLKDNASDAGNGNGDNNEINLEQVKE
jgi:hypothetical protein